MREVVFFHRASRTLVLADLIENFERAKLGSAFATLAHLGGVMDPDGISTTEPRGARGPGARPVVRGPRNRGAAPRVPVAVIGHRSAEVNPSRMAYFVSSAMVLRFSFAMTWRRCVSTVGMAIPRAAAISLDDLPSAMS
jgi:hypothetical protein